MMKEKVGIEFLGRWRVYQVGEVASFDPNTAKELVENGIGKYHNFSKAGKAKDKVDSARKRKVLTAETGDSAKYNTK